MKRVIYLLAALLFMLSCGQTDTKQKELELKERELALKEKEFELRTKDSSNTQNQIKEPTKIAAPKEEAVKIENSQIEIPTDGSAVTEFTKEMLLSDSYLADINNGIGENHNNKVGIIDHVTKEVKNEINTISVGNHIINVSVPSEGKNMTKESLIWFNKIVKPGTKIKYSYHCTGNEFKGTTCEWLTLTYLKLLPK